MPKSPSKTVERAQTHIGIPKKSMGIRKTERAADFKSIYANDIQLQTTQWDVRLILGVIDDLPTEEQPFVKVNQMGELRISPQMARQLLVILATQLRDYEARFGPVPSAKQDPS